MPPHTIKGYTLETADWSDFELMVHYTSQLIATDGLYLSSDAGKAHGNIVGQQPLVLHRIPQLSKFPLTGTREIRKHEVITVWS